MTKKIYVTKGDEVTQVVERLIDADAKEVVLSIPKFSKVGEAAANFHLLRREAEVLGKKILVESVDEVVLKICEAQKIPCVNPFFAAAGRRISDIVPKEAAVSPAGRRGARGREAEAAPNDVAPAVILASHENPKAERVAAVPHHEHRPRFHFRFPFPRRRLAFGIVAVLLVGGFLAGTALRRADITLAREAARWQFQETVVADKDATGIDLETARIPGQRLSERKNVSLEFAATGKRAEERRARGTIIIYNAFGSQAQPLVARTRFVAPDGKVFRLTRATTVPGAKVVSGKVVPSSIEAEVAADAPGPAYNVGPVSKLTIPGFAGTPKFDGFYADSKSAMRGGASGEVAYPTEEDIAKARAAARRTIEDALRTLVLAQVPEGLTIPKPAARFSLVKEEVDPEVTEAGKFSVFVEGELAAVAYREEDLRELLRGRMQQELGAEFEVVEDTLAIREAEVTLEGGTLRLPVAYEGTVARAVDLPALKRAIAGKREDELKRILFRTPGLASARVSLWPFWVRTVPDPERIELKLEVRELAR